jgi:hypothetical protein
VPSSSVIQREFEIVVPTAGRTDSPSNVHSDLGAAKYGFKKALVFAVSVYGWSVPMVIEALGERWVSDGWTDIRFRRPVHHGDVVMATVTTDGDGRATLEVVRDGGDVVTAAELGVGTAPWAADFHRSPLGPAVDPPDPKPLITRETAPVGQALPILRFEPGWGPEGTEPITLGGREVVNPATLASRMSGYGRAVFSYTDNTSLDVRRHVQHMDLIAADEPLTVAGFMRASYERRGNDYAEYDGTVYGGDGRLVALVRHTVVVRVAPRPA